MESNHGCSSTLSSNKVGGGRSCITSGNSSSSNFSACQSHGRQLLESSNGSFIDFSSICAINREGSASSEFRRLPFSQPSGKHGIRVVGGLVPIAPMSTSLGTLTAQDVLASQNNETLFLRFKALAVAQKEQSFAANVSAHDKLKLLASYGPVKAR
ncbi:unnamed protein product, partial [Amoebophrya sp. A25]|eukprot:GSA25T00024028001.1